MAPYEEGVLLLGRRRARLPQADEEAPLRREHLRVLRLGCEQKVVRTEGKV